MANLKLIRAQFNITQEDISSTFRIPLRTVQNWDYRNSCPGYMYDQILIYYSTRKEFFDDVNETFQQLCQAVIDLDIEDGFSIYDFLRGYILCGLDCCIISPSEYEFIYDASITVRHELDLYYRGIAID